MAPAQVVETSIGSLNNYDGDVNESGKKPVGLDWQNNNFARASRFFCTFLCRRCTTTTWKCLISRFVENVTTRQQLYFYFPELRNNLLKFNSRKNWTTPTGTIVLHLLLKNFCIFASFPSISPASRLPYHSGPLLSRAAVPICPTPQARFLFSFYRLFFLSTVSLLVECLSTSSCREEGLAQRTESRV